MSLSMRQARKKDVQELCVLMDEMSHTSITIDHMLDRLKMVEESKIDSLYVCEDDGKILGLLGFRIRENLEENSCFGEISAIVVNFNHRRRGVGHFMMAYAEKLAKEFKCKGIWLVSGFAREKEAHIFFKYLGFQTTGYRFVKILPK